VGLNVVIATVIIIITIIITTTAIITIATIINTTNCKNDVLLGGYSALP